MHQANIQNQVKPEDDPQIRGDPYRTLFVARLSYEAKEPDLEREFARFGPIERIRIVRSKEKSPKNPHNGYAFIVYEREKDMKGILCHFLAQLLLAFPPFFVAARYVPIGITEYETPCDT